MGQFKTKILKSGKFQVYESKTGKVASEARRKEYLKLNLDAGLPKANLTAADRRYIGAVRGGINRAKSAITDTKGHFLSKAMEQRVEKMIGGKLEPILKAKGAKDLKELLRKDDNFRSNFFNVLDKSESSFHFNSNQYQKQINDFPGKITINGKEVTKVEAIKHITDLQQAGAKKYQKGFDFSAKMTFKGLRELSMILPTADEVEATSVQDMEKAFGDNFRVYGSD